MPLVSVPKKKYALPYRVDAERKHHTVCTDRAKYTHKNWGSGRNITAITLETVGENVYRITLNREKLNLT